MNKVILVGHLGKDPHKMITKAGNELSVFTLATHEKYKDKNTGEKMENVTWHNILVSGYSAPSCNKMLKKGDKCFIEGKIQIRKYEKNGVEKVGVSVIVQNIEFLVYGKKKEQHGNAGNDQFGQLSESNDNYGNKKWDDGVF